MKTLTKYWSSSVLKSIHPNTFCYLSSEQGTWAGSAKRKCWVRAELVLISDWWNHTDQTCGWIEKLICLKDSSLREERNNLRDVTRSGKGEGGWGSGPSLVLIAPAANLRPSPDVAWCVQISCKSGEPSLVLISRPLTDDTLQLCPTSCPPYGSQLAPSLPLSSLLSPHITTPAHHYRHPSNCLVIITGKGSCSRTPTNFAC